MDMFESLITYDKISALCTLYLNKLNISKEVLIIALNTHTHTHTHARARNIKQNGQID